MKKYITAALLFCAALTAACSKETAVSADTGDTGALEMRVSATRAEADGEYDPLQRLAVRIYRASSSSREGSVSAVYWRSSSPLAR